METIGLQQYSFHFVETAPFNGRHSFDGSYSFYWRPSILVKTIPFSGSHFRQWKPFLLEKTFAFRGNHCPIFFKQKLLLLIETFPFSGSYSFQCFNSFIRRSYRQLREFLNINDSVRLLKMANLSCIHIPVEVFQSSEAYLGSCRTSVMKRFYENC